MRPRTLRGSDDASTTQAASMATSVPAPMAMPMAMPTSARASAGASVTAMNPFVAFRGRSIWHHRSGGEGLGHPVTGYRPVMIIIGLILLLLGSLLSIPLLWTAGVIVLVVGLVLMLVGRSGRRIGGRAHFW